MEKIKINEIFWSTQGEGLRKGISSIFLRLAGCSMGCSYCDSKSAWHDGEYLLEKEIVNKIEILNKKFPGSQVVITGGEPLEQNIDGLVNKLKDIGFYTSVETNGAHYSDIEFNWWAVSPKDVNDFGIHDNLWEKVSEIKLIVNRNLNLEIVKLISEKKGDIPIFLQPQFPDPERFSTTFNFYEKCIKGGLKNIRLGIQMHRSFSIR